jgi:hypothetical protein
MILETKYNLGDTLRIVENINGHGEKAYPFDEFVVKGIIVKACFGEPWVQYSNSFGKYDFWISESRLELIKSKNEN